jgi:cytochrome P460
MTKNTLRAGTPLLALLSALTCSLAAQADAPSFNAAGELERPSDFREWIYLTSGLDMFYGPAALAPTADGKRPSVFTNVYVTPPAYREFLKSGTWPDKTMFILEVRRAESAASIDNVGKSQGALAAIEAAVKDVARFGKNDGSNGWGYFSFDGNNGPASTAKALPTSATCYSCHAANTAVDNTFVQYYPTLYEVAKRLGTVKPTFDPAHKL